MAVADVTQKNIEENSAAAAFEMEELNKKQTLQAELTNTIADESVKQTNIFSKMFGMQEDEARAAKEAAAKAKRQGDSAPAGADPLKSPKGKGIFGVIGTVLKTLGGGFLKFIGPLLKLLKFGFGAIKIIGMGIGAIGLLATGAFLMMDPKDQKDAIDKALKFFKGLGTALSAIGKAFSGGFMAGMDDDPITGKDGITTKMNKFKDAWKKVLEKLGGADFGKYGTGLEGLANQAGAIVSTIAGFIVDVFTGIGNFIADPSKFIGKVQGKIMALFDDLGNLIADFWTEGIANPRTWRNMLIGLLGPEAGAAAAATFGLSKGSIQEKETAKRQEMEDRISKIPKLIAEYEKELEDNTKNYTGAQRRFMASEIERLKSEKERNEDKIENINTLHMMDNAKDELAKRNLEFQLKEGIDLTKLQEEATAAQKEYNEFMAGKTKSFTGQTIDANVGGYEFFVEAENDKRRAIRLHRAKVEGLVQDAIGLTDTQLEEKSLAELLVLLQSSLKGKSATVQKDTIEDIMTGEGWLSPEQHKQQLESLIVQQKQLEAEAKQKLLAPQQALAAAMSKMDTAEAAVMIDLLQKTGSVTGATLNNLQRQTGQGSSTVFVDNSVKSASTSNATIPMITNPVIPGDSSGLLSPSGG